MDDARRLMHDPPMPFAKAHLIISGYGDLRIQWLVAGYGRFFTHETGLFIF